MCRRPSTAFFVPESLLPKREGPRSSSGPSGPLDLLMMVNAKRMGLSFEELGIFRVRDFLEFTNLYFGQSAQDDVLDATQEDIDKLLG